MKLPKNPIGIFVFFVFLPVFAFFMAFMECRADLECEPLEGSWRPFSGTTCYKGDG